MAAAINTISSLKKRGRGWGGSNIQTDMFDSATTVFEDNTGIADAELN